MLGISYGELFLLLGAIAALIGPKDLPVIARTVGRLSGRAIGYVQVARGQFESIMQQSQARQVHKELQDTMAQLEAIRHEIRTISFMNPGLPTRLVDNVNQLSAGNDADAPKGNGEESTSADTTSSKFFGDASRTTGSFNVHNQANANEKLAEFSTSKDPSSVRPPSSDLYLLEATSAKSAVFKDGNLRGSASSDLHCQATVYAKLAESTSLNSESVNSDILSQLTDESGRVVVLPVSAETAKLLPKKKDDTTGSDVMLEAVLEAGVARDAKDFVTKLQKT